MRGTISWRAWQSAVQPAVESILGRPLLQASRRSITREIQPRSFPRRVRTFSTSHVRGSTTTSGEVDEHIQKDIKGRKQELDTSAIEQYPRIQKTGDEFSLKDYVDRFETLKPGETNDGTRRIRVSGRVTSIRKSGNKLAFIDICEEPGHYKVQLMLNLGQLSSVDKKTFSDHVKLITRGDVVSAEGVPTRTSSGELSLLASSLPKMLSPCLHRMPLTSYQSQTAGDMDIDLEGRHVEMLVDPSVIATMVARSKLIKTMHDFFNSRDFLQVQTPILAGAAGGATARPFETTATEFSERKLWLRIAPELWLKRLVLGGLSKIYEIGPSFRNEGLDQTHNPEFTTCEFYATHHTLPELQRLTEDLFRSISQTMHSLDNPHLKPPAASLFDSQFQSIDFIPALNNALNASLPNLTTPSAHSEVLEIFKSNSLPLPSKPTLPRLLDKLSSIYLEPHTTESPSWIINTPECLSPLAKSFIHPTCPNSQPVAARAELFIHGREIVNCYEEENSPWEQRRKFLDQQHYSRIPSANADIVDEESHPLDTDYLRALEWGLPPTGGWGCGIDRLVMLFTGKSRIADVLSFGNLRAVTRGAERWERGERSDRS